MSAVLLVTGTSTMLAPLLATLKMLATLLWRT
jgi:hypothetical protein